MIYNAEQYEAFEAEVEFTNTDPIIARMRNLMDELAEDDIVCSVHFLDTAGEPKFVHNICKVVNNMHVEEHAEQFETISQKIVSSCVDFTSRFITFLEFK